MKNNIISTIIRGLFGVDLPEQREWDLQQELAKASVQIPTMSLPDQGAVEILTEPFDEAHLLEPIQQRIARDYEARQGRSSSAIPAGPLPVGSEAG